MEIYKTIWGLVKGIRFTSGLRALKKSKLIEDFKVDSIVEGPDSLDVNVGIKPRGALENLQVKVYRSPSD